MQVSVEETSSLGRKMTVQVPAEKISQEVDQRLDSMKGRVKIDGFRPGKVPLREVKRRYGGQVLQEVMTETMQSSYREAIQQEKLQPAGGPKIEPQQLEPGEDLKYIATFDIYPEVVVADMAGIEVEIPVAKASDEDVDKTVERLRKQRVEWNSVDRPVAEGDQVTIDFQGKVDGELFEGGEAKDFVLTIGDQKMIKGFEEQLVGLSTGEKKEFAVTFPEDYANKDLAGKEAVFAVELKQVDEGTLPEIDEEFVKSFGVEDGSVETLRTEIRKSLDFELEQKVSAKKKAAIVDMLVENNDFELPLALVEQEIKALKQQAMQNFKLEDESKLPDNLFEEEAGRRVKLGLIIHEIAKTQKLTADQAQIEQRIQALAGQYERPEEVIQYYSSNQQARASVEGLILEEQALEWVLSQAKSTEKQYTFDELVNTSNG